MGARPRSYGWIRTARSSRIGDDATFGLTTETPNRSPRRVRSLPDVDQLNPAVLDRFGCRPIEQLFLAQADRLDTRRRNPERIDQRLTDCLRTLLADPQVVCATALPFRVADDQEATALQIRVIESVRDERDDPEHIQRDT